MKAIHTKTNVYLWLSLLLILNACDSFVAVDLPESQLTNVAVFEDNATANAALTNIYSKIRDNGILTGTNSGISNQLANYTDDMVAYGNPTNPSFPFYNDNVLPSNTSIPDYWNASYNQIYSANAILEGVDLSTELSEENKKLLQGEAFFIRALVHFYLVNLFGDVPYIKETDYRKNATANRMPTQQVYENIILDLEKAITLLPENYSSTSRVRPTKYVAKALLSRTYLYTKAYTQAANEATTVLNQTAIYSLEENLKDVFLLSSKETIWQLQAGISGQNTQEAAVFVFLSGPPSLVALSDNLVASFAPADMRKTNWTKAITDGTTTWYHANKYKERDFTGVSKEYSIVFRLAELYLIRAEARAHQGDLIGAKEDLNIIMQRAGLAPAMAISQAEIITAIVQERRWEFFTEHGHRFFDLKRLNLLDNTLSAVKPGWNTTDQLFPIPQSELSTNPNLRPQNPGY
ncbi:SusD family protein [Flavobacterium omnivorum]|uniref:SusD family protein n=1 Tax=Flavobacterium omnivorum TaxID=178355 RepID=A0A1G7ZFI6_9FLAO|nr:RagB/SusD family nutrient uptake outer membrane protein [Flavobacterium omnivorum]SDH07512.1 SusD family protein [Flavobacterium omnivorum]